MRNHLASYAYSCCPVLRAGQPLPTISSSSHPHLGLAIGSRRSKGGKLAPDKKLVLRACSVVPVQVGHSFALVNTFTLLVHLLLRYVPVPVLCQPVPTPCFQAKLTFCLSSQLCSFNNLLGRLSRRAGQAARGDGGGWQSVTDADGDGDGN